LGPARTLGAPGRCDGPTSTSPAWARRLRPGTTSSGSASPSMRWADVYVSGLGPPSLVEMIVDRGHLETTREQTGHHRGDLLIEQDEIPHDHGVVTDLLERRVGAQGEPGLHRHALHRDTQIRAGHPDPKDVT